MNRRLLFAILACTSLLTAAVSSVDEKDFDKEIAKGIVLVDFYGPWCGPCKRLAPVLELISEDSKIKIIKVNIDNNHKLAEKHEVTGVPVLILFKNGKEQRRIVGFHDKSAVKRFIDSGGKS